MTDVWIFGHTHPDVDVDVDVEMGRGWIISNPRGYLGEDTKLIPDFTIEICPS